jgi:hypothetical protein
LAARRADEAWSRPVGITGGDESGPWSQARPTTAAHGHPQWRAQKTAVPCEGLGSVASGCDWSVPV